MARIPYADTQKLPPGAAGGDGRRRAPLERNQLTDARSNPQALGALQLGVEGRMG